MWHNVFTGLLCHLDDACTSNPCHADAICDTSPTNGSYTCSCASGYKGVDCSEDIDECEQGKFFLHSKWGFIQALISGFTEWTYVYVTRVHIEFCVLLVGPIVYSDSGSVGNKVPPTHEGEGQDQFTMSLAPIRKDNENWKKKNTWKGDWGKQHEDFLRNTFVRLGCKHVKTFTVIGSNPKGANTFTSRKRLLTASTGWSDLAFGFIYEAFLKPL